MCEQTIKVVLDACVEILESKKLLNLFEILLAIGNYLNGGTFRGGAWGFKLDVLTKVWASSPNYSPICRLYAWDVVLWCR